MKPRIEIRVFATFLLLAAAASGLAATHYVDLNNPNPTPPYTTWGTAATNIQNAVESTAAGDEVVVTNGIYASGSRSSAGGTTNRVLVEKPLTLRSINGPQFTAIDGGGSVRCLYLTNGACVYGFTLTNGSANAGAGVWCESLSAIVSNCLLVGNSAYATNYAQAFGGGVYGGTLESCTISSNSVNGYFNDAMGNEYDAFGGGAYGSVLINCALNANSANGWYISYGSGIGYGGGAFGSSLSNCTVTGNSADGGAGGDACTLDHCELSRNSAALYGGGAGESYLTNCTLSSNLVSAVDWSFGGGGAALSDLNNCSLTGNVSGSAPNGYGGGVSVSYSTLNNCIVYYNSGNYDATSTLNHCCTTPARFGNITNAPLFVDAAAGNLRLQSNSPCINAGNNIYAPVGPDLDDNPRIVGGTVDIGAYEYQNPASHISYAWLQQYTFPTDGSADFTDPDGDGMTNWQEWRCGTDPTSALSALRLFSPAVSKTNVMVTWQSVAGVNYFLERSSNLTVPPVFTLLATNIVGQSGTTTYTDTNAAASGPFFYRVGVR